MKRRYQKKTIKLQQYVCPNPSCYHSFTTKRGLSNHYSSSLVCQQAFHIENDSSTAIFNQTPIQSKRQKTSPSSEEETSEASYESIYFGVDDDIVDDYSSYVSENIFERPKQFEQLKQLQQPINSYTPTQKCEIKLLKILNDANVPHSLYREIVDWADESFGSKFF